MGKDVKNAYFGLIILIFIFGTILLLILKQGEFTITGKFIANTETVDSINSVGDYSSIALDSDGYAHISYRNASGLDLKYCNNTLGTWSCATIETTGGYQTSIAIDSNNKVHVSHYDSINGDLRYCNNTLGTWGCASIDDSDFVGGRSSIAIDSNNKVHISYYDSTNDDLKYCNNLNGTFVCEKIADADASALGGPNGRALAIKKGRIVDSTSFSGLIHMSWYNNTDLMYTSLDPFFPTIQFVSSTTSSGNYSNMTYIWANVTANDTNQLSNITIYLYNSTSLVNKTIASSSPLFLNFTNLPDGTYYLNATANDTKNNTNQTETRTIILDTTAPSITFSCDAELITQNELLICTCSATDSGVGVNTTTYTTNPSTATIGTFSTSCTSKDNLNHSASANWNYEIQAPTTPSDGGGGSGGEGTPSLTKTSLLVNVNPGEETTVTSFNGTGIKEITIIINQPTQNIRIQVLKYDSKPANVSKNISEKTYKYLQINTENLEGNLEKAKVKFEVNKSWLAENSLDKEDMVVLKFDETSEKWNELDTLYDSEDESYHYYVVELNSFSYFAIGEKAKIPIVSAITDSYEKASQTKLGLIIWWSIFVILIIGVIIIITLIITELKKERFGGSILN